MVWFIPGHMKREINSPRGSVKNHTIYRQWIALASCVAHQMACTPHPETARDVQYRYVCAQIAFFKYCIFIIPHNKLYTTSLSFILKEIKIL